MNEPITVSVTAADIEDGDKGSCARCPVALALQRATGDAESLVVSVDDALMLKVHYRYAEAPPVVRDFVLVFDFVDASTFTPFSFTLPPLDGPEWFDTCEECDRLMYAGSCEECGT